MQINVFYTKEGTGNCFNMDWVYSRQSQHSAWCPNYRHWDVIVHSNGKPNVTLHQPAPICLNHYILLINHTPVLNLVHVHRIITWTGTKFLFYGTEMVGFWTHAQTIGWRFQHFVTKVRLGATGKTWTPCYMCPLEVHWDSCIQGFGSRSGPCWLPRVRL